MSKLLRIIDRSKRATTDEANLMIAFIVDKKHIGHLLQILHTVDVTY